MKKLPVNTNLEEFYIKLLKSKSAKERLKMLDGLFKFAKRVNPNYFKWQKYSKAQRTY